MTRYKLCKPLGTVVETKETENGITFTIQNYTKKENTKMMQCDIEKVLYDSYVAAGFSKTDAKEFVTLKLKND